MNTDFPTSHPIWTYTSDSCGYMLFQNGDPIRGARTLGTATHTQDGKRRHWKHIQADRVENAAQAKRECDKLNALSVNQAQFNQCMGD